VFVLWLVLTLAAANYFIAGRLMSFDPNMKLSGQDSSTVIKQVRAISALKNVNLNHAIIHFTSDECSCTQYSDEHKRAINEQAKSDGFYVININLPTDLLTIIPSTPAILITGGKEELLYFGPYSAGLACSASNGYVETVLQNYAQGFNSDLVISDVKGCYCNI
jgi:hypothetical protein|tara:strand:- start:231 stop:722 length:492 start_codon:yes stop_codon:yes gene_type:complete